MNKPARVTFLLTLGALVVALRILAAPRPLDFPVLSSILNVRARIAIAALVAGAGFGIAALAAQARARDASVDASLTGPVWGALPALLLPVPLLGQALAAVAGAGLVAYVTNRGPSGFSNVLARGVAVAGAVVSLAALGLFLGPGLTPSTATAFLHAALGGEMLDAQWGRTLVGGGLVLGAFVVGLARWRSLLLERAGIREGGVGGWVVVLASAGGVLVAGVVAGVGLIAARLARGVVGEHPLVLAPGVVGVGAGVLAGLDGISQAVAWPGELPVGVVSLVLASGFLCWRVVPRDQG